MSLGYLNLLFSSMPYQATSGRLCAVPATLSRLRRVATETQNFNQSLDGGRLSVPLFHSEPRERIDGQNVGIFPKFHRMISLLVPISFP